MSMKMMTPLQVPVHRSRVVGLQALLLADTAASLLQIFGHHHGQHHTNHVITKSLTSLLPPALPSSSSNSTSPHEDHLLQSCRFCSTKLSPKEDVYMYRGDQGFCSRKCRDKQVKLDQIKEAEESNLIFHLNNSYNSSRRRRQLKAAPLLQICSSDGNISAKTNTMMNSSDTASNHRQGGGRSIPRRRPVPVQYYYNRPLPLPPHQRLGYMNRRRQLAR